MAILVGVLMKLTADAFLLVAGLEFYLAQVLKLFCYKSLVNYGL
jgi:hypothetical protein